jgi:hypothetical protein
MTDAVGKILQADSNFGRHDYDSNFEIEEQYP